VLAKVHSCAIIGLEGAIVEVEVDTSRGLPSFTIVGLPDMASKKAGNAFRLRSRTPAYISRVTKSL